MPKTPSYRKRAGRTQALVTLTDSVTRQRHNDSPGLDGFDTFGDDLTHGAADQRHPDIVRH